MHKISIGPNMLLVVISINAQVCFTYDNAGNRVKRQSCVSAFTNQENDELSQGSPNCQQNK